MSDRRLLVTGAGGFVGRQVVEAASRAGFEVHAWARRPASLGASGHASWTSVDLIADEARAAAAIAALRPTHLLHAAWCTEHGVYWHSEENRLWVEATKRLADAFARAGGRRFVMVGSCAEYAWSKDIIHEDHTPTAPATLYGACKLAAHQAVQALAEEHAGFSTATGRIFFAYGPHEDSARIIPYICRSLAAGEPALLSSGTQVRDFLYVPDVARGLVSLLESSAEGAVNVASGEPVSLAYIARTLGSVSGRGDLIRLGARPDRPDDDNVLVADNGRLRALGWTATRSLEQGLGDTYAWWADRLAKERVASVVD